MDTIKKLSLDTININKQAIIFVPSRASAEKTAEDLSKLTSIQLPELEQQILKTSSTPTKQCRRLSQCIKKGTAFHHAGLLQKQKDLIEEEFKKGTVKIICATPTLAAGLSLPVFRVIIKNLKRFSGKWGMDWIPVLEYLQMAGRAGRPEYESFGEAIVIAKDHKQKEEIYNRYILGKPEEIYSKLAVEPVLRTYLLSLISSGIISDKTSMKEFFSKTFWSQQFKDMNKLEEIMERMLYLLEEWNFVRSNKRDKDNDFITANNINEQPNTNEQTNIKLQPTLLGKRISELYLDPLTAKHLLDCLYHLNKKEEQNSKQNNKNNNKEFSLLQMISHTLEMRPLLRTKVKEQELIQEKLVEHYDQFLEPEPNIYDLEYSEFINSIKTTLFFQAWIEEKDEDFLLENYNIRPGEIKIKLEIADWLLYATEELSKVMHIQETKINHYQEIIKEIKRLRIRVKNGVKEELLPLLKFKGIGRVRARKLFIHGIKDLGHLKNIDITSLSQIIGKTTALNIKNQLGEKIKTIPKGKRKGQLSLMKF